MLFPMKTTLNLRDDLLAEAKARAVQERTTLTRMIEEDLALRLRRPDVRCPAALVSLPVSRRRGGLRARLDPVRNQSLFDAADE